MMDEKCYVKSENTWYEAKFIGVFQASRVVGESPMVGGHKGGMIAHPVAVVKLDGKLKQVLLSDIAFRELG